MSYDFRDRTPDELLQDLQSSKIQGNVGAGSYEIAAFALHVHAAKASERAADTARRWVIVSALAACASAAAAGAAVIVAIAN